MENVQLQRLLQYVSEAGRICPQPNKWHELWDMLPDKQRRDKGWDPPLPFILWEWDNTSDQQKIFRLKLHVQYAATKGILDEIEKFLKRLNQDEWYTL